MKQTNLPDLAHAAKGLRISVELESIKDDNVIAHSILKQLRAKNLKGAISIIEHIAKDNRHMATQVVGEELLSTIEDYLSKE